MDVALVLPQLRVLNPNRMCPNRRCSHFRLNSIELCSNGWNDWALSMVGAKEVAVDLELKLKIDKTNLMN